MTDNNLTDERTTEFFRKIAESVGVSFNEVAENLKIISDALSDGEGDDVD